MPGILDAEKIREDFPIFRRKFNGRSLIYLDNAATTQKPRQVIDAVKRFYEEVNANPHRGVYSPAVEATEAYEEARRKVARMINADSHEIIFVRNATDALNLAALMLSEKLGKGDSILMTEMEHHSNLVPWQLEARRRGLKLKFIPFDAEGYLDLREADRLATPDVRVIAFTHASNVLGTITPVDELVGLACEIGAYTVLDAAQSVPHMKVDVRSLGVDFMAFSGHKMLGPTGVGVLYCRDDVLGEVEPFFGGGEAVSEVGFLSVSWREAPWRFEPGTPNTAGVIGLGAAVDYLGRLGMERVRGHEVELTSYAMKLMEEVEGLTVYGPPKPEDRAGIISFNLGDIHPHDLAAYLDQRAICIRAGHHCAMPLHEKLGVPATARASFYIYNTVTEINSFVESLEEAVKLFKPC